MKLILTESLVYEGGFWKMAESRSGHSFFLAFIAIFAAATFSCMNDVDSMISDYDSNFKRPQLSQADLSPGDEGFDETNMLMDKYTLANDQSLTLTAPRASSYSWEIWRVDIETTEIGPYIFTETKKSRVVDEQTSHNIRCTGQIFQIPKEQVWDLFSVGTYEIHLTVAANGFTYRDAAQLFVVKQFYEYY